MSKLVCIDLSHIFTHCCSARQKLSVSITDEIFTPVFSIFGWDWGTPAILQQYPNKITLLYGCGFGLKKLGLSQTQCHFAARPRPSFKPVYVCVSLVLMEHRYIHDSCSIFRLWCNNVCIYVNTGACGLKQYLNDSKNDERKCRCLCLLGVSSAEVRGCSHITWQPKSGVLGPPFPPSSAMVSICHTPPLPADVIWEQSLIWNKL